MGRTWVWACTGSALDPEDIRMPSGKWVAAAYVGNGDSSGGVRRLYTRGTFAKLLAAYTTCSGPRITSPADEARRSAPPRRRPPHACSVADDLIEVGESEVGDGDVAEEVGEQAPGGMPRAGDGTRRIRAAVTATPRRLSRTSLDAIRATDQTARRGVLTSRRRQIWAPGSPADRLRFSGSRTARERHRCGAR